MVQMQYITLVEFVVAWKDNQDDDDDDDVDDDHFDFDKAIIFYVFFCFVCVYIAFF